jgi:thiol-disulfide isomerase/thioredoxin
MKKILLGFLLVLSVVITQAQEIKWTTDMKEAVTRSMKENKPIMLFFTGSDWCGWCHRLQAEVFNKPEFGNWVNNNVIPVELDFPRSKPQDEALKAQNNQLGQMLGVQGYPTVWFVTPTISTDNKINLNPLGSQGYAAGGPTNWINLVSAFLPKRTPTAEMPTVQRPTATPVKKKKKKTRK